MIDLGRPAFHAEGVTVFPDHAEPNKLHYLPDRPRVRLEPDGSPELKLLKYRLDPALHQALGAGMLSLTVDLAVEPETLESLRRRVVSRLHLAGPAVLVPVAPESGTCELVLVDRASRDEAADAGAVGFSLVERILGAATPSLYGDNAATFMAVLSAEGVALAEGALRGGGLPASVVYNLQVLGLRPALRAEITARWKDVYDFYENRLHGGKLLVATDIGPTLEDLVHSEAIRIHIDELVPQDEKGAVYQRALDEVQRYVLEELFKPTLGQAPPATDARDDALATIGRAIKDLAGFFSLTYSLREVKRDELKTFTYQLAVARAERITFAPQGTLSILLGTDDPVRLDRLVTEVEPGPSPEMKFDVASAVDLQTEAIDRLEVFLSHGGQNVDFVLDEATPRRQLSVWHRPELGSAVSYRYETHFRPGGAGSADLLRSPERTTEARVIRLNPRELYRRATIRAVAQGLPFDRYPSVLVDLKARDPRAGWSTTETLVLDAGHPEAAFTVRAGLEAPVRFERRVRYVDVRGGETVVDWEEVDPGILVVGDPLPEVIDLAILGSARFGTRVARLVVQLRPAADPAREAVRILSAEQPAATWSRAAPRDADRSYEYRVTVHTTVGEMREGPWLPGPQGRLVVGEGIAQLRTVELMFVGKSLAELALLALKVRFAYRDPQGRVPDEESEVLVEDTRKPIRWSYAVADPQHPAFSYQLTFVKADGTVDTRPSVSSADLLVIQPLA